MAQVDGTQGQQFKPVKVDLLGPQAAQLPAGLVSEIDPTEDAWAASPPPPKGPYRLKLFLGERGCTLDYRDRVRKSPEDVYYHVSLECRVVDNVNKELNGRMTFANVNTRIGVGKHISTVQGLLIKMGAKIPAGYKMDDKTAATHLLNQLKKEPVLGAYLDWNGSYQPTATAQDPNPRYKTIFRSMDEFPLVNGVRQHIYMYVHPMGREEIVARAQVQAWYGATEAIAAPQAAVQTIEDIIAPTVDFGALESQAVATQPTANVGDDLAFV